MSEFRTIHEHIDEFRAAMREAGVAMTIKDDVVDDGKLHRYYVDGDPKGRRNGWFVFHGDGVPAGSFGRWGGVKRTWSAEKNTVKPLTREERDELARKRAERKAREAAEEAARMARAARRSQQMWEAAAPAETHPYLTRKGIGAHGVRVGEFWKENKVGKSYLAAKNALLIAMKDASREIVSLQAIYAEPIKVGEELRGKDFVFGGRKVGVWAGIVGETEVGGREVFPICEGYATAASAHKATGLGVIIAFDAGNLLPVAREIRRLRPQSDIVILADNDQWTKRLGGGAWNPGVEKAREAAAAVGGTWVAPLFRADHLAAKPTDWNDLNALEGLEEVRRQIMAVIAPAPPEPPRRDGPRPVRGEAGRYARGGLHAFNDSEQAKANRA